MSLRTELEAAGLTVETVTGWGTRGGSWAAGKPIAVMEHHTSLPVPYPVDRLYGTLLKCNINTKPDGTVWLIAANACNYSSGSGSGVVLDEVRDGIVPTANALERDLADTMNGNPWFFNFENDHEGDGRPIPAVQHDAIVTATRVILDHYGLGPSQVISHAEWTRRKRDPYWNGSLRAIEAIREQLEDKPMLPIVKDDPRDEVVRSLKQLLNDTYETGLNVGSSAYDGATVAAVKAHLGSYTGNPDGKEGKWVGGIQWARMLADLAMKHAGQGEKGDRGPKGDKGDPGADGMLTIRGAKEL